MKSRRLAALLFVLLTVVSFGIFLHGEVPDVPTGQWLPGPALAQPRTGAVSVALDDGRVLVIGGRTADGPVDTVEVFGTDGSISVGAHLLSPRAGHAAAALPNGRVLVAGGTTLTTAQTGNGPVTSESVTSSAEIFDTYADAWYPAGSLSTARTGLSATRTAGGRVLVAGGTGENGAVLDSFEVFDEETGTFSSSGLMSAARTEHAAALAGKTKVLVAGGRNPDGVLDTADLIDLETGGVSSVVLTARRAGATATALLDGTVLVAGGSDGFSELASAEIVDPTTGVSAVTGGMAQPRQGQQAVLLDNNNTVLIVGGTSAGAAVPTTEQFIPWAGVFAAAASPGTPRTSATSLNLSKEGIVWLAAGRGSDGSLLPGSELYGFATLKTDHDDYAPGTVVVMSGSGWQPGERVTLVLHEIGTGHADRTYYADADSAGRILNSGFTPDVQHLGVRFNLTARGAASQAQVAFTDGRTVVSATLNGSTTVTVAPGATISATVSVTTDNGAGNANWRSTSWRIATTPGAPFTCVNHSNNDGSGSYAETFNVTAPVSAGTYNAYFIAYSDDACSSQASPRLDLPNSVVVSNIRPTSTALARTAGVSPSAYGASVTFTVTVTATGGNPTGVGTVTFKDGVSPLCTAVPLTLNTATCTTSALSAAASPHSITAEYSGTTSGSPQFQASSSTALAQVVDKANQTITFGPLGNKVYGDAPFTVSANASSGLAVSFAASDNCTTAASTVTFTGAGPCTITASQGGDGNYNAATAVSQTFTITKAAATVVLGALTQTYTGSPLTPTATTTPAGLTIAWTGAPQTNAGTYPVTATVSDANYEGTASGTFVINKAVASVTLSALTQTYTGSPLTPTAATTPAGLSIVWTGAPQVDAGSYALTATVSDANYEGTASGTFVVTKAAATIVVTPYSVTYDGNPHTATGTAVGAKGEDLSSLLALGGTTHTAAGTFTGDAWTFAGDANYAAANGTVDDVITKAAATIVVTPYSVTYDGNPHTATGTAVGAKGEDLSSLLALGGTTHTEAGTFTADVWTFAGDANYVAANGTVNDVIGKATATIVVTPYSVTYDGNPHTATGTAVGAKGEDLSSLLALGGTTHTEAGTFTADVWTFAGDANYAAANGTVNDVIGKAAVTVTAGGGTATYDGLAKTPAACVVAGAYTGDLSCVNVPASVGPDAGTTATAAGVSGSGQANFAITLVAGAYTITAAGSTTVVTCPLGVTYNGAAQEPCTVAVTGAGGLNLTPAPTYASNTAAGTASASYTFTGDANHTGSTDSEMFVIAKKAASVTAHDKTKTYGDDNPALTATIEGTIGGETLNYTLASTAVKFSRVDGYPIEVSLGSNPNYDVSKADATLSITPKGATVTANDKTRVYGAANPTFDAEVVGTVHGDTLNYTLATTATTTSGVGSYSIDVTLGTNVNYTVSKAAGALLVTQKALTITANSTTKVLGATLTFAGTEFTSVGLINGDSITSVTLTSTGAAAGTGIGSYPIVASVAVGAAVGNYAIAYIDGMVKVLFLWDGFLQPINDTAHDVHTTAPFSKFKLGQTIPAKFDLKDANGNPVTQTGNPTFNYMKVGASCTDYVQPETLDLAYTPSSVPLFVLSGGHYQFNWSTKGLQAGLYSIYANLADGTSQTVNICFAK